MTTDELIRKFIGKNVIHDSNKIYGEKDKGGLQPILDVRGWGAIQNMFTEGEPEENISNAAMFQDEMALWIVDAINKKLSNHDG